MKKKVGKRKKEETASNSSFTPDLIDKSDILTPLRVEDIGSNNDPCFGKAYDLTTDECKCCGDSELCACVFAQKQGSTRKELNKEMKFLDLQDKVDLKAVKKYIRGARKREKSDDFIMKSLKKKYLLSTEEAKSLLN